MKRFVVCGSRHYSDESAVDRALDAMAVRFPGFVVVHGGAAGADELAGRWAKKRGHPCEVFVAEWAREGRAAGPLRNQRMLDTKPDGVVGLPGGTGTAHMCRIAEEAGVKVWRPYG